jgi:hypothetical protein
MAGRRAALAPLGVLLVLSGCPEPDDEAGDDELGDTGESDEADSDDAPDDDDDDDGNDDDDVRPPIIGDGDSGDGDGDGDPGDGDGDGENVIDDPDRCWDDTWSGDVLPHVILGNTTDRVDSFTGSCGLGAAPDYQLGFVAPWSGHFAFDTAGSSFDTVVYAHEQECGPQELACNDDFIGLDSRIVLELDAGELITLSVDGTGAFEQGLFTLEISEAVLPVCETEFIQPNLPTIVLGDNSEGLDQLASGCGGEGAPEHVYEFVAPGPGSYRFDTFGSSFDTVLYALDECDGPPLACNDDADFDLQSELVLQLAGGQQVLIVVDGFGPGDAGPFLLNVEELP